VIERANGVRYRIGRERTRLQPSTRLQSRTRRLEDTLPLMRGIHFSYWMRSCYWLGNRWVVSYFEFRLIFDLDARLHTACIGQQPPLPMHFMRGNEQLDAYPIRRPDGYRPARSLLRIRCYGLVSVSCTSLV
jgi:hypothetical protein